MFGPESPAGQYSPPIDVYETDEAIEVTVDLPGVAETSVRIVAKGESLLIAGEKRPLGRHAESTFHLVERDYGRFARGVRLGSPCSAAEARAILRNGELRISLPKIGNRRGTVIPIRLAEEAE
jgi:HSP20 family protein